MVSGYLCALNALRTDIPVVRTVAVTALMATGLWLAVVLEVSGVRPSVWVTVMCTVMGGLYAMVILIAPIRDFVGLTTLGALSTMVAIMTSGLRILDR